MKKLALFTVALLATLIGCGNESTIMENSPYTDGNNPYYDPPYDFEYNTESYDTIVENPFLDANEYPLSTFSIDVDAASYSNVRRFLNGGQLPPCDAVKIEEMVNYFTYDYPDPASEHPFSVTTEVSACPWHDSHRLIHIGLQGEHIEVGDLPPSNLVFLLDVSGSMSATNKLPLLKQAFGMLVEQLTEDDRIAIVTYSSTARLALPSTTGDNHDAIMSVIYDLTAGGSTAGAGGIQMAYDVALENFREDGNNRVILATDGDFNVGISDDDALIEFIESNRDDGVFLTVLGFGVGNLKASKMEKLADHGNGNFAYIDNLSEAEKVLVSEIGAFVTIAKDVKIQVEFNPELVDTYRLLGYENRLLQDQDYDNDSTDAGDMGAGHSVTALYEYLPVEGSFPSGSSLLTFGIRYKRPDQATSLELTYIVQNDVTPIAQVSDNFVFSAAVAQFGLLLRNSLYKGSSSPDNVLLLAQSSTGSDVEGYRREFIELVHKYIQLTE